MHNRLTPFILAAAFLCLGGCHKTPPEQDKPASVESVTLNTTSLELEIGENATLTAYIRPQSVKADVTWTSSHPAIASVAGGVVTALSEGSAVITATAEGKSDHCRVTVRKAEVPDVEVETITLKPSEVTLAEGESLQLTADVQPINAADRSVTWSTSNPAVAGVDKNGLVTAVSTGSANIAATHGNVSGFCKVTVTASSVVVVPVESITLNRTSAALKVGESVQLAATVSPGDATDPSVSWSSSNTRVAAVTGEGFVRAREEGKATITARAGDKTATCLVTVSQNVVAVTDLTLSDLLITLKVNETHQLTATVSPSNATDKTVFWSSSDNGVATVSSSGLVTAIGNGTANIYATAGNVTKMCLVSVSGGPVAFTLSLNRVELDLHPQETFLLVATVSPSGATNDPVTWNSNDTAVATVSENGLVTAVGAGNAWITARIGREQAACSVTVTDDQVAVTSILLNKTSLALNEGETFQLTATVYPEDATDKTVTWTSSNTAVAAVGNNGLVVAISEGTATVTATAGSKSRTCQVSVSKNFVPVESVTLNETELTLDEDESFQFKATVKPDNATDKSVIWTSSDPAVVSVFQGWIYANAAGTATITAQAGNRTATCRVTVRKKTVPVSSVELNKTSLQLFEEDTFQFTATVGPDDASDKTVTWKSSNTDVATIDRDGLLTARSVGSATVTATAGGVSAQCIVNVSRKIVHATSVVLDRTTLEIARGRVATLTATVLPENATDKTITWSSSNKGVATVDKNGNVTAITAGSATITAAVGSLTASCAVTVIVPVSSITLNVTNKVLKENETLKLTATVKPTDASHPSVTWTTDRPDVATVDDNGVVTAVSEGIAVITATADDVKATCTITVSNTASGGHEGTGTEIWD